MEKLKQSHDVTVYWRSFELRPSGAPPISPEYRARIEAGRPRLYAIARDHYGLELKPGPWGINSRPALVGAKYAEVEGVGDAYHQAIFEAYWLHERSIEDRDVLRDVAESVGLEGDLFLNALESPELDMAVTADVTRAQMVGITGVPALVFEQKYLVSGAQPYEVLVEVVDEITANSA